jgi:cytochrome c553
VGEKGGIVPLSKMACVSDGARWAAARNFFLTLAAIAVTALFVRAGDKPPDRIPSYVEWTPETIAEASSGDPFRGLLLARHCAHCHGDEGFAQKANIPNLASMDRLTLWKQLQDFRAGKRVARPMNPISRELSSKDVADVAAYYSKLPIFYDPEDNRVFPQPAPDPVQKGMAWRLATFGDGERGIPPCQACHGPVAYRPGAPSLMTQNADYVLDQLEAFANRTRTNDINEPMRTISILLSEDERHALAAYYGAGLGMQPGASK